MENDYCLFFYCLRKQNRRLLNIFFFCFVFFLPISLFGEIRLPNIYHDGMILQREKENLICGNVSDGEEVTLSFGELSETVNVDADGNFCFCLKELPASSEPQVLKFISGSSVVEIKDVLVGDVYLLGGQSNMALMVKQLSSSTIEQVKADADYPLVRFYTVAKYTGDEGEKTDDPWVELSAETAMDCSAVGFYFARALQREKQIPIGLINCSRGSSNAESWISAEYIKAHPELQPYLTGPASDSEMVYRKPGILYEKMLSRVLPYTIGGVLWYQGEANAKVANKYGKVLPAVIDCFRETFSDNSLPFVIVQLSAYQKAPYFWPLLREVQDSVASVTPHTAMVSSIDAGSPTSIHPLDKEPVGLRCALAMRHLVYGDDIEFSGPTFRSIRIDGESAVVSLANADGLHTVGNVIEGFEICDESYVYKAATNVEIVGSEVRVSNNTITQPVAVRYAWSNYPLPNLYNSSSLPANPFRTSKIASQPSQQVFYCSPAGSGNKTGSDWDNAAPFTTATLKKGNVGDMFWVKSGIYDVTVEFSDRRVYGGFCGTEESLEQRDWNKYPTVIKGKVNATNSLVRMESNAELDGFILQDNHLAKASFRNGAGVQMGSKTVLRNCIVRNNKTIGSQNTNIGGGVFVLGTEQDGGRPLIENCLIVNNSAPNNGGGIQVTANGALHIIGSTISNNLLTKPEGEQGSGHGCGIGLAPNARLTAENCIIYRNRKKVGSVEKSYSIGVNYGIENCTTAIVRNCAYDAVFEGAQGINGIVFAEETACIDMSSSQINPGFKQPASFVGPVVSSNDRYEELVDADYSLLSTSPCINVGDYIYAESEVDLLCSDRIVGENIDMGAYEYPVDMGAGVNIVNEKENGIRCFVDNGYVVIANTRDVPVALFDISGQLIKSCWTGVGECRIMLPSRGMYILKIGELTEKVLY